MRLPFRKRTSSADLEEEFAAHLAIESRQLMERGMTREQAEAEARREFGNRTLLLEEMRGMSAFERIGQDFRYAARVLRRSPAFTAAAVLSLALGIGATTAVFSIADTVYLRPLPYTGANQLVWASIRFPGFGGDFVPSPDYVAWRRDNHVFQQVAATQAHPGYVSLLSGPDPAEVYGARVSANFLQTFGIHPLLGPDFRPEEELPNAAKTVILAYPFWRDYFHARAGVVGSVLTFDGQPFTVIGILPPTFVFPVDVKVDILATLPVSPTASHHDRNMMTWAIFARLKPGVTLPQARADLETLLAASRADAPQMFRDDNRILLESLRDYRAGDAATLLAILLGASACLLAIASANVANLLLARWSARSRELAVRAAIGAGRARLARQLFAEIALLIAAGTFCGMLIVGAALRAFVHFPAGELPRMSEATMDLRVFGIALLTSIATALLFGALPALRAGRVDLQTVLQSASRSSTGARPLLRRALVSVEVALSVVLLTGAALLFQTLWHLRNDHLGFQPEHLLTVTIPLRYVSATPAARAALADDVLAELHRIPGTEAAALTECTPLTSGSGSSTFNRSDRPIPEAFHRGDEITRCGAGPEYLEAVGAHVVRGRFFTEDDYQHPRTLAVINEAAARAYFPGEDPIGKQILGKTDPWKTVVGVISDTRNRGLNHPAVPEAWFNDVTDAAAWDQLYLVRTLAAEGAVARVLHASHRNLFIKVQSLDSDIADQTASPRFNTVLLASFAALAFLMAIVGVYGVLAFSVAQRNAEIGIRMALGASPQSVLSLVMKESAVTLSLGALAGIAAALSLTRYLTALLYGVTVTDPRTYLAVVAGLALAASAASFLPARRAALLDPAIALRQE